MNRIQESLNVASGDTKEGVTVDFSGILLDESLLDAREEAVEISETESHILGDKIRAWRSGL